VPRRRLDRETHGLESPTELAHVFPHLGPGVRTKTSLPTSTAAKHRPTWRARTTEFGTRASVQRATNNMRSCSALHCSRLGARRGARLQLREACLLVERGERPVGELRSEEIAAWRIALSPGYRFDATQALRQVLARAVVWGMIDVNPAKLGVDNPSPRRREQRPFESWAELDAVAAELSPCFGRW
jgi:hypothetical protein